MVQLRKKIKGAPWPCTKNSLPGAILQNYPEVSFFHTHDPGLPLLYSFDTCSPTCATLACLCNFTESFPIQFLCGQIEINFEAISIISMHLTFPCSYFLYLVVLNSLYIEKCYGHRHRCMELAKLGTSF